MSLVAKPKDIFRNVVVATAGDLGNPAFDDAGVNRYVTSWGGRFSADFDESVTHLLVSKNELKAKRNHPLVSQGQKRRKLEIVTVDWLEDSISKKKKQPAKAYSLKRMRKEANAAKKRELDKNKNIEKAGYFINPDKYRVYTDSTFFRYEVLLTKGREEGRFMLTLFESVGEPRLYHTALKYWHSAASSGGGKTTSGKTTRPQPRKTTRPQPRKTSEVLINETPGSFQREFAAFTKLFRQKTGVPWDDRLAAFGKGKGKVVVGKYIYEPPTGGKPVGLVEGRNPLDEDADADDEKDDDDGDDDDSLDTTGSTAAVSTTDSGSHTSPNVDDDDDDGIDEKENIQPENDIDEAVRAVLGPAMAAIARADEDIAACAVTLGAYEAELAADGVAKALT